MQEKLPAAGSLACYKQIETSVQKMQTQKSTDIKVTDNKKNEEGTIWKKI